MPESEAPLIATLALLGVWSIYLWGIAIAEWRGGQAVIPWRPRRLVPWHPLLVLALFALGPLSMASLVQAWWPLPLPPEGERLIPTLAYIQRMCLSQTLLLLLIPAVLTASIPTSLEDFGLVRSEWQLDMEIGVRGFLMSLAPVFLVAVLVHNLRKEQPHLIIEFLSQQPVAIAVPWVLLTTVVLAPLAEELTFRVLLQGMLESRLRPRLAIVVTAIAFVGVHSVVDMLPLFPLALILGYVYYRRHSYIACVLIHALFNGLNLLLALFAPDQA